jgi:hypothetical protein
LEHVVEVNIVATDGHDLAFREISAQTGDLSKTMENGGKVLDVHLGWRHKHGGIICIKGRPKDEKERQERITLPETPSMVNGRAGNAIKEHPGSGGGKQGGHPIPEPRREPSPLQ